MHYIYINITTLYPSLPKDSKSEVVITSSEFSERPHFLGLLDRLISRGEGSPWTSSFMNGRVDLNNFLCENASA